MMKINYNSFLFLGLFCVAACGLGNAPIAGKWQAVAFYENGQSQNVSLDSVRLELTPELRFTFQSIGHYREAGPYRLSARFMFLTDTTVTPQKEHTVKVLDLSPDTLKIQMRRQNQEQVLFLARVK
ncbi:MAG: hypothetical protein IT260_00785 [Saprospiraceae bacterium]|nr:hypothetical protein [Saprospiraceae bacterium]